jgi:site-specific DNA recombinase
MRTESGGYRRDHPRALAQRVEEGATEVRIMGSKSVLLRTNWRATADEDGHYCFAVAL